MDLFLMIFPFIVGFILFYVHSKRKYDHDSNYYKMFAIFSFVIGLCVIMFGIGMYTQSSDLKIKAEVLQKTLDNARENNEQFVLITLYPDVAYINKEVKLKTRMHENYPLWVNDDVLEIETVK